MDIITTVVLFIFAIYGLVSIISDWVKLLTKHAKPLLEKSYVVITVKNCQDNIEGTVRTYARKMLSETNTIANELIIIDTGSQDDTLKILSKLEKEYDFIHIMTKESYINMLNELE